MSQATPSGRPPSGDRDVRFASGHRFAERYRIVRLLGRGGMGEVYQAEDLTLGQTVALKFLPRSRQQDRLRREMLLNEVRLARQVIHPHVCQVYDIVEAEDLRCLSMEYVDGENLAALLKRIGRLPQERALVLSLELCRGLDAAHRRGILHRDLKPANLMLDTAGHIRITDFGLARLYGPAALRAEDSLLAGIRAGTPAYMAPEQHRGEEATVRSDLYALGLVLYELFTGRRACRNARSPEVWEGGPRPAPPSRWLKDLSPEIERVILHCLEADPERRPSSAGEIAAALEQQAVVPWRPAPGLGVPFRPSWRLERKLGQGGFGEAWVARHRKSHDLRVFKFCHEAAHLRSLKREITLFRLLKEELGERDDITRILDWNFAEPPWFIESELTEGGHLEDWAAERGGLADIPLEERLEIVAQVAVALAAAHSIGVLHKDVKPSNILVRRDAAGRARAQVADFGIGTVLEHERLERAGITVLGFTEQLETSPSSYAGTRLYMAPELLEGKSATLQADIYALGVVLYQMVVGDFSRALAPGWHRDVPDELLRDDVATLVEGRPERRLGDAQRLAERLRALPERRAARAAALRADREAAATRAALEQARRRRRMALAALAVALLVTVTTLRQAQRTARAAARAENMARLSIAGEWLEKDPTRAALVLLEVDDPDLASSVDARMRQALRQELAFLELRHEGSVPTAAWHPDGSRILTASGDGTARIWNVTDGRALHVLRGHDLAVRAAAWSPDGSQVATVSEDATARLWPLATPDDSLVLRGHGLDVLSVAWSHDGSRVATTSNDGTARVWNARNGQAIAVLRGHEARVRMAAWSPDGQRLVTASDDGTARVWELGDRIATASGEVPFRELDHRGKWVWMAAWSPDGRRIVTAPNNGKAHVWPGVGEAGEPVVLGRPEDEDSVRMAAWSPDGRRLAAASEDGLLRLWPGEPTGQEEPRVFRGHEGRIWSVRWSGDGERLLTTSDDGTARIWFVATRHATLRRTTARRTGESIELRGHAGHVGWGAWSPDGRSVLTTSVDYTARVWRPESAGEALRVAAHGDTVHTLVWSPDGRYVLTASTDGTASIWPVGARLSRGGSPETRRPASSVPLASVRHDSAVLAATWDPDRQGILAAFEDGSVRRVAASGPSSESGPSGPSLHLGGLDGKAELAAWSGDGRYLLFVSEDGTVRVRRLGSGPAGRPELVVRHPDRVIIASWSPDAASLLTVSGHTAYVRTVTAGAAPEPLVLAGHKGRIYAAAWSHDSTRVATVSEDGTARIWGVEPTPSSPASAASKGTELDVLDSGGPALRSVAWSPDDGFLVTGLGNGQVLVWEVGKTAASPPATTARRSGKSTAAAAVLKGHNLDVRSIVFSPDGRRFATSATEGRVLIWDFEAVRNAGPWNATNHQAADTPRVRPRTVLEGHGAQVEAIAWSPDGRYLASASQDGIARIWWLAEEDLRALLGSASRVCLDPEFRRDILLDTAEEARRRYADCERAQGRMP